MRCHEARQKLSEINRNQSELSDNPALIEHIQSCPNCAACARAEQTLIRDLQMVASSEIEEPTALGSMRLQVENVLDHPNQKSTKETTLVSKLARNITRSPKLGFSIATVAIIVTLFTLIPFKYQETVGYEVAVAGVNKDVALDASSMHQLLAALGLPQADFDVVECDNTCLVKITDLKSEGEIKVINAAFKQMGNSEVREVKTVFQDKSGNIVRCMTANNDAYFGDMALVDDETNHFVFECLDSLSCDTGTFSVFLSKCNENTTFDFTFEGEVGQQGDGNHEMYFVELTGDAVPGQCLSACSLMVCSKGDTVCCVPNCGKCPGRCDGNAKEEPNRSSLPNEYGLYQNYPNPFNPTTEISFSIPRGENVKLEIFNVQGQKVRTLIDAPMGAGEHVVRWDGNSEGGTRVASGIYLYRLQAGEFIDTKKMTLVK